MYYKEIYIYIYIFFIYIYTIYYVFNVIRHRLCSIYFIVYVTLYIYIYTHLHSVLHRQTNLCFVNKTCFASCFILSRKLVFRQQNNVINQGAFLILQKYVKSKRCYIQGHFFGYYLSPCTVTSQADHCYIQGQIIVTSQADHCYIQGQIIVTSQADPCYK